MVDTAIAKYDKKKNNSFYIYWRTIAENAMKHFVKNYRKSHTSEKKLSLDQENESGSTLHDTIASEDIDERISLFNSLMHIINDEKNGFTEFQKKILHFYLEGYDMKEIADMFHTNKVNIYRNYHSAINKIRRSIIIKK